MNYNLALHQFMLAKAEKISEDLSISPFMYYNALDRKAIKRMAPNVAERVWDEIVQNIKEGAFQLNSNVCPFCVRKDHCGNCIYAKNHSGAYGIRGCGVPGSSFDEIMNLRYRGGAYGNTTFEGFSNGYYKKLIEKIKKELK